MEATLPLRPGDRTRELLAGMAAATALVAVLVVGVELRGAGAGDPVDIGWIAIAALTALTTIGGTLVHRRRD